ncbi:hypothetical protein BDZ97DRAFT_1764024 [Flammula alnicola]|nr:hypothetical protein BDZ97DRAFT_1764024 [Flammula alnicola]
MAESGSTSALSSASTPPPEFLPSLLIWEDDNFDVEYKYSNPLNPENIDEVHIPLADEEDRRNKIARPTPLVRRTPFAVIHLAGAGSVKDVEHDKGRNGVRGSEYRTSNALDFQLGTVACLGHSRWCCKNPWHLQTEGLSHSVRHVAMSRRWLASKNARLAIQKMCAQMVDYPRLALQPNMMTKTQTRIMVDELDGTALGIAEFPTYYVDS